MAAEKGNLYAIGNNGGRPPQYDSPEKFAEKLNEYIEYEDSMKPIDKATKQGKGVYTIEGAALFLGFATRDSFYDYAKKEEFSYIVNRFKLFLTDWNVKKLYWAGTFPGAKFWLTNHGGYTEETVQHQNQTVTKVTIEEKKREG